TEAVVTSGGVSLKNLKPTGESKLKSGIYFVGETIDVDALTGGFNLQLAYATGVCAARDILKEI
ncbi:MAG: NAD(P)/FAD-dependent oxidoreductase, partial [Clostridia bacterium]|nr:NAD(P)/FAD-dependent oxidoreductase [Clostridia bacterium]